MDEEAVVRRAQAVFSGNLKLTPHSIEDILGRGRKRGREEEEREPLNLSLTREERVEGEEEGEEEGGGRRKKVRTTFTGRQIFELEKMFETRKYLNAKERSQLSRWVNKLRPARPTKSLECGVKYPRIG